MTEADSVTAVEASLVNRTVVVVSEADSSALVRVPVEVSTAVETSVVLVSLHTDSALVPPAISVDKVSVLPAVPVSAVVEGTSEVAVTNVSTELALDVAETPVELSKVKEVGPEVAVADDSKVDVVEM